LNLFFDLETTGLPNDADGNRLDWEKDYNEFPHIVEIAWKTGKKIHHYLVAPQGKYRVPLASTAIHGITNARAEKEGKTIEWILEQIIADAMVAEKIIGHNVYFDTSVLKANALRTFGRKGLALESLEAFGKDKRVCTMRLGRRLKGGKWPKLQELYVWFFGEEFSGAHGAKEDVLACERIYKELVKRGEHEYH
jgi:DNA polymerase III epsilon subunit-like protein